MNTSIHGEQMSTEKLVSAHGTVTGPGSTISQNGSSTYSKTSLTGDDQSMPSPKENVCGVGPNRSVSSSRILSTMTELFQVFECRPRWLESGPCKKSFRH